MTTVRNPDATRESLLNAAIQEIHRSGFRSASLDSIIAETGVTKGALYHHFPSKTALGYAVVEEILFGWIKEGWIDPLSQTDDPATFLAEKMDAMIDGMTPENCSCGCPLNNLNQEMSSVDEGFRERLVRVFEAWRRAVADALARGQRAGTVIESIDPDRSAHFLVASWEGAVGAAKNARDPEVARACAEGIRRYLETLRPGGTTI